MAVSASAFGAHVIRALRDDLLRKAGAELRRDANLLLEQLEQEVSYSEHAENQVLEDDRARRWLAELRRVLCRADDRLLQAYDAQEQQRTTASFVSSLPIMRRFTTDRYLKREISSLLKDIGSVSKNRPPTLRRRETGTYHYQHDDRSSCDGQELMRHGSLVEPEKIEMRILPLVDKLTEHQEPPRQLVIFALYGLGGVGKTTIARKIYDDQRTQSAFSTRVWVSISRASSAAQILQATCAALQVPKTKEGPQAQLLADRIGGRRVFLVFNVHNSGGPSRSHHHQGTGSAEIFGNLVEVLKLFRAAAQESRVLVTTTDENVGIEMKSAIHKAAEGYGLQLQTDRLWQLTVEDGWTLLLRAAGLEQAKVTPELKKIGVEILQRCNCLPLAIEAVGGVLRRKGHGGQEEWERVRDSRAFDLRDPSTGTKGGAGSSIYLSYQYAPPHLKQCFLYLSLFPADLEIERHLVTQLWISEGLTGTTATRRGHSSEETAADEQSGACQEGSSSSSSSSRHNSMGETAQERAQNVALLRDSSDGRHRTSSELAADGGREEDRHRSDQEVADWYLKELAETGLIQRTNRRNRYRMHDQARKIAESLTENEVCAGDPRHVATLPAASLICLSFLNKGLATLPEDVGRLKGLRTLLLSGNPLGETDMDTVCKNLGLLRVLDLSDTEIRSVPKSLGNLAYLRHLDLSRTGIRAVHESIGRLRRLRFLGLRGCQHLTSLPKSIQKLLKLEYLDFRGSGVTRSARLHSLRHLTLLHGFVVDSVPSNGVLLEDLRNMSDLSDLQIDIRKTVQEDIAGYETLKRKGGLRNLELRCCTASAASASSEENPSAAGEPERLETMFARLRPHRRLVSLKIDGYHGTAYPEWLCPADLPNLQRLSLENCGSCERLPPIWHLQKLKFLRMANLSKLRAIDTQQPPPPPSSFPAVEEMEIEDMEGLEHWSDFQAGDLLHLRKLALRGCPKLSRLPGGLEHCKVISTMELRGAGLAEDLVRIPVQELLVEAMPNLTKVSNLPLMKAFTARGCPTLETLSGVDSLQHIHVRDEHLGQLPRWLGQHFPRIETLDIEGGEELLARCERGREDWYIVREIPRVYAYLLPNRLPYFSYARSSDLFCKYKTPGADARKDRRRSPEAGAQKADSAASPRSRSSSGGNHDPPLGPAAAAPADATGRRYWPLGTPPADEIYKKFLAVMSLFVVIVLWMITSLADSHRNLLEDISLFCFYVCTVCYFIFLVTKRRQ